MSEEKSEANAISVDNTTDEIVGVDYLRLQALRNIIYHNARRYCLESISRWINFCVVLTGTATAASLSQFFHIEEKFVSLILGAFTAILGASSLVFDFAVRAKNHEILAKDYFRILAEIEGTVSATEGDIAKWRKYFAEVAANEPPTMRALDAMAQNEASQSLFGDDVRILRVNWWQRALKNVLPFGGTVFNYTK